MLLFCLNFFFACPALQTCEEEEFEGTCTIEEGEEGWPVATFTGVVEGEDFSQTSGYALEDEEGEEPQAGETYDCTILVSTKGSCGPLNLITIQN